MSPHPSDLYPIKPVLRGWSHAVAAVGAAVSTALLGLRSLDDLPRLISLLIYGLSMVELFALSATYHLGRWQGRARAVIRALDHASIFVLIAGTFTPIAVNVLPSALGTVILAVVWSLAVLGAVAAVLAARARRWLRVGLYVGLGSVAVVPAPVVIQALPAPAVVALLTGASLYGTGALVYGLRRPDPFPRVFGFHELFHALVIGGAAAFLIAIWVWVVPYPRP